MKNKPSIIRRILKVFAAVILILLVLMVLLPFLFKGQIMEAARKEINNNLEAKVDFEDFGLNLFAHFPDFSFHLDHISVAGINDFEGDTLAVIESVSVVLDLFNVVKGDAYEIKSIHIARPDVYLKVAENGKYNWDIALKEETDNEGQHQSNEEGSNFQVALKKFEITDAHIVYDDVPGNMKVTLSGTNHILSGDLTADNTSLQTRTNIAELLIEQNGITYLNKAIVAFDASIDADLKNEIYTFKKNALRINELALQFEGSVAIADGDPDIILTFDAQKNTFRNFLSLVPAIYQKDFKDIETEGDLSFSGYVKGVYTGSDLPSFRLEVLVDHASFKYPELPSPVTEIQLDMDIDHPGGDMDKLTVDVRKFRFSMLDNPFDMALFVSTPVSDPYFSTRVNGRVDLSAVSKVYPLGQDEILNGSVDAAFTLKGRLSSIEKKAYKDVDASGSVLVKDFIYSTGDVDEKYEIKHAQLNFAPAYLDLVNLDFLYGSSDISLKGKIENYLAYALGGQELKGELNARSKYFNANQFISGDSSTGEIQDASDTDTAYLSAFRVPANLDIKINTGFNRVIYDNMELSDVEGIISIKDEKLTLNKLNGKILGGTIGVNGFYDSRNTEQPLVDLEVNISRISFQKAFATFGILQKFAPVFDHAAGDFSTSLSMNTRLKQDMNPDWGTFIGKGLMNTSAISLQNVNTLDKLADVLKIASLKELDVNPLKLLFDIRDGKLFLKPTNITMEGIQAGLAGWTSIDETMEYTLKMEIPKGIFGEEANAVLDNLLSQAKAGGANVSIGNTVNLDVLIGGTLSNPTVKPAIGSPGKGIMEDISTAVQQEIDKKKEELEQAARAEAQKILNEAEKQALKVVADAQKQADQIRKTAREAAQTIRTNADAHAKTLVEEGKKKGMLAETAAKKTAEEYKKKAYSEADQMVAEADKKADGIINTAKQQAAKIRSDAQKKVDAL